MRRALLPLLLALLPAAAQPAATRHAAIARDWTRVAAMTPDGGMRIGNPAARARIVEYASMTCPHCAAFATTGFDSLARSYVRPGLASFEVRSAVRDRFDLVATLLARCGGPQRYFATAHLIFAHQDEWIRRGIAWQDGAGRTLSPDLPIGAGLAAIADGTGLTALVAQDGITPAMAKACLADPARQKIVTDMTDAALNREKIAGTPAFVVNDDPVDAHDWATLEPSVLAGLR